MGSGGSKHKQARAYKASERPSPPGKPYLLPESPPADPDVITIKWDPPIYGGGSKIVGYVVEHKRTVSPHWVKASPVLVRQTQLSVSGLEPGMRYQFRVFAENSGGRSDPSPLSEPIAITHQRGVAIAPVFLRTLHDLTAIENEKVEFTVRVDGTPFPKISWYKDGFEVFSNRRQRVSTDDDTSTFVIHQAALSDEGEIKCSATNKAGHAVAKAILTLQAPPTIRTPRQYEDGLLFELGEAIKLKVSVSGRPQPEVTWYHNNQPLLPGPRVDCNVTDKYAMLRVSNATREDRGEYQVRAVNILGEDSSGMLITITDRPLPPGKVNVVMTLGRCVTLAWTIPYDDGGCKIGNYIVEYFRIGWNMWLKAATCRQLTTTIGDLIEGSEYKFRVKAENPYGISDPSEESDIIFIPDPKRGLMEPPAKGAGSYIDESAEEWLSAVQRATGGKSEEEGRPRSGDWMDDDSPIPSPVILAHQVLKKVKMAPKRTWSEDSQGSPPKEISPPPSHHMPVPPRRKHRVSSPQEKISPIKEITKDQNNRRWKELSPRSNYDEIHSSSEMMLVLLPNKETGRRTSNTLAAEDFDNEAMIAPPMSLSAPELSSCEPFDFRELRLSASSSEIMHELALIRMNQEVENEEVEANMKRRYGLERKRSFERRSSLRRDNYSSSKENLPTAEQLLAKRKELLADMDAKKLKRLSGSSDEFEDRESRVEEFSERFRSLERGFKEYSALTNMKILEEEESDKMSSYSEDDYDEDTYHPRNMTPKEPISPLRQKPPMVTINEEPEPIKFESPKQQRKEMPWLSRVPEPQKRIYRGSPTPDRELVAFQRSRTPSPSGQSKSPSPETSRSPSPNIFIEDVPLYQEKHSPPSLPVTPKPILKVREKSAEPLDSSQTSLNNKKVRIEVPGRKNLTGESRKSQSPSLSPRASPSLSPRASPSVSPRASPSVSPRASPPQLTKSPEKDLKIAPIPMFPYGENAIGLAAGEVARSRRKKQPSPVTESPAISVVDHYSDIVREYGQGKKAPPKLYLSYDELKAAAERAMQDQELEAAKAVQEQPKITTEVLLEDISVPAKKQVSTLNTKSKFYLEYVLDLSLFLVACWIYLFKDVRLTIPIILLLIYRQIHETVTNFHLPWRKKQE